MTKSKNEVYGKRLKEKRLASGKTQAEVAKEIGVLESAYQRYEHGRIPTVITACKIAKSVGEAVEVIWGV